MNAVFTNDMLLQIWAQQSQERGRNTNDSISFCGAKLRSYGMDIGKFIDNSTLLFTSERYSLTKTAQKTKVLRSIHPYINVFTVPCLDISPDTTHKYTKEQNKKSHLKNTDHYKKEIKNSVLKASRASRNKDFYNSYALGLTNELNLYIDTFKLRFKHYELPNKDQVLLDDKKQKLKRKSSVKWFVDKGV